LSATVVLTLLLAAEPAHAQNSLGMDFVQVPAGEFIMGSSAGDWDELPEHKVILKNAFFMSVRPVSLEQFKAFQPEHAAAGPNGEAVGVSWADAAAFCDWLSTKEGKPYRLPTEAEWEYACRAGTTTPYPSGEQAPIDANWANAWGLVGMQGGTPEWCLDWYGAYPAGDETDPVGAESGLARVIRGNRLDAGNERFFTEGKGGDFHRRSANRASMAPAFGHPQGDPGYGAGAIGFRIVQVDKPVTAPRPADRSWAATGIKAETGSNAEGGPDPDKPYFRKRFLLPTPPETSYRPEYAEVIAKAGLHPALCGHNHCPALTVCPNGDLLMIIYSSWHEYEPGVTFIATRLRAGHDEWDMPSVIVDMADANDHAPLLWTEGNRIYLFWGSPWLKGAYPFQWITSDDNGATWSAVNYPNFKGSVGTFSRQPINSVLRAADGTLYVASDAEGPKSVLWATHDDGKTWYDTQGRSAGRHTTYEFLKDGRILGMGGKNSDIEGYMPRAISADGGATWTVDKSVFPALAVNQRPSLLRLKSGRLFFAGDYQKEGGVAPADVKERGSYVALSNDDGATWHIKKLEAAQPHEGPELFKGADTLGYSVARQSADGIIHLLATMNRPCLHFAMNEAWILSGDSESNDAVLMANSAKSVAGVQAFEERYPDGKPRYTWSAGRGDDGRYLLDGAETWYYPDGTKQYQAEYKLGVKVGNESYWGMDGKKQWEWEHAADGSSTWRQYWDNGALKYEGGWRNLHAEGPSRRYDRDGKVLSDVVFHEGLVATPAGQ
jgi:formylglycine-generating enzyme required for sulfatase activity